MTLAIHKKTRTTKTSAPGLPLVVHFWKTIKSVAFTACSETVSAIFNPSK
jgi:hypothetical protein